MNCNKFSQLSSLALTRSKNFFKNQIVLFDLFGFQLFRITYRIVH